MVSNTLQFWRLENTNKKQDKNNNSQNFRYGYLRCGASTEILKIVEGKIKEMSCKFNEPIKIELFNAYILKII